MVRGAARATEKSTALLKRAADGGDRDAAFALGVLLLLGRGIETDFREAQRMLNIAVEAGIEDAVHFRELAEEQLNRHESECFKQGEAAVEALLDAKRRELFPPLRLVEPKK